MTELEGWGELLTEGSPPPDMGEIPVNMERLELRPKLYLNGFPKSGLHLAVLMGMCLVDGPAHETRWAGTFTKHAWSAEWMPDWRIYQYLARLKEGAFLKGHCGWRRDIADFLRNFGVQKAFIYRDLRDVAISMSYHVLSPDDDYCRHDDKDMYRSLAYHEDVILACIRGLGDYPGLIDRWELYAGWLEEPWVHPMPYERMRLYPLQSCIDLIQYVYARMASVNGVQVKVPDDKLYLAASKMVDAMGHTELSPTYRKGAVGGWQEQWTGRIDEAFRDTGGYEWLERLGYTDGEV